MRDNTDSIIAVKNAAFGYEGSIVVHNISFVVRRGDYLCILGENGSGKSTLLKGVLRFINPLQGNIHFSRDIKATGAGYLSQQEAVKKDFPAGVSEIVLSGFAGRMGLRPFYSRVEKDAALENMKHLLVDGLKGRCFRELSGGQQRRVLIARSLCAASGGMGDACKHGLLLLDEPASGLDPLATAALYKLLAKINKESGVTILSVTHDAEAALRFASHILHIKKAKCFFGTVSEYKESKFAKVFDT